MERRILDYAQNRELSWLRFNQRVLDEARDVTVPLLERLKFVAIFTSNLDEFFMIRVGSLDDMANLDRKSVDVRSGMTPQEQLDAIYAAVGPLYKEREKVYAEIKKELSPYGVIGLDMKELDNTDKKVVRKYFRDEIMPVLSPQIIDPSHPFPHLQNNEIYVVATLRHEGKSLMGIVPLPSFISEVLYLPGDRVRYIRVEKIIMEYMEMIFEQYEVLDKNYLCVTRNADISPDDEAFADDSEDFRIVMQKTLHKRRRMAVVRLETFATMSKEMEGYFCEKLQISPKQIFKTKIPLKMGYIFSIADKLPSRIKADLTYPPFTPQPSPWDGEQSVMSLIRRRDVLLHYPYESMDLFLRLLKEASLSKEVLTIKITIYRLASQSRLVEYLCAAAENGKEVTVLIELRARFDEQNNIDWSARLEEAGCRVIYGMEGYKVHSKLCLITYRHRNEIQYITQVGTGNYNEKTAKMYTDYSFITAHKGIGEDANAFFRNMLTGNLDGIYHHLICSPLHLRGGILDAIDEEIKKGDKGRIIMKMNSMTDIPFMNKIEEASMAGVRINLIIRGICCMLPGLPGKTENVTVTSIVGRFLEHPRLFAFGEGTDRKYFLGSADMMTRNTEKRVEVAVPIYAPELKAQLRADLELMLSDNIKARVMGMDGIYKKIKRDDGQAPIDSQAVFMKQAIEGRNYALKAQAAKPKRKGFWAWLTRKNMV